jgi:hypothetical protein
LVSCFSSFIGADTAWDAAKAMLEGMRKIIKEEKQKRVQNLVIKLFEYSNWRIQCMVNL